MFSIKGYKPKLTSALLSKIAIADSVESAIGMVFQVWSNNDTSTVVSFINAHAMNLAHKSPHFYQVLLSSDVLLRDGIGMKILMKSASMPVGFNANGTDFIPNILKVVKGKNLAIFGTSSEVVALCKAKLEDDGHKINIFDHGFHEDEYYLKKIINTNVEVIILGMGMPRQELLANKLKNNLNQNLLIINGGAILDFMSGSVSRAPLIFRKTGCEWLYRLLQEPRRLWKRYILGNVCFLLGTIQHLCTMKK